MPRRCHLHAHVLQLQLSTFFYSRARTLWCRKCDKEKPPRAHHCSMCNACFLRMDHHCPWVVGCVGFRNHKYFLNFLVYCSAALAYATAMQHSIVWNSCLYVSPLQHHLPFFECNDDADVGTSALGCSPCCESPLRTCSFAPQVWW
jgi:hypothetical protein